MPAKIIGMIGTQKEGVAVHLIKGKISREWVIDFTRLHEQWNYDSVLVGYYASAAEGFAIALYAADHTDRIKFLIAHRPGSVAPALAARQIATFDQLTQGRMSLHVIAGTSDADQASEGDFLPKNDRYRRAGEYLDVIRRIWTSDSPFNHHGEFYRVEGAYSDIKPYQQPYPRLFFGGSSDGALKMGAEHCDVFAIFGEPLAETRARVDDFRRRTAAFGRRADFNMSLRPIMAETEGAAWDKAHACWRTSNARPARRRNRATIPANGCSAMPRAPMSMTNGCGWGLRAPPAHPAIPRAWSGRRNRSRPRYWNITGSASIRSCCADLKTRTTRSRSGAT